MRTIMICHIKMDKWKSLPERLTYEFDDTLNIMGDVLN